MWNNNTSHIKVLQPPPVLQQFNAFEILTPQKVDIKSNLLVDLSPDENNSEDKNIETELNGSLIDTVTKKNYDLIDVFQNIYVTPQHVTANVNKKVSNEDFLIDLGNIDTINKSDSKINVISSPHNADNITEETYKTKNIVSPNLTVFHDVCRCKESNQQENSILSTSKKSHDVFIQSERFRKEVIQPILDEADEDVIDAVLLRHPRKLDTREKRHLTNSDCNDTTKNSNDYFDSVPTISSQPVINGLLHNLSTPLNIMKNDNILSHDNKNFSKLIAPESLLNSNYKCTQDEISLDYFPIKSKAEEDFKLKSDKSHCSNGYNIPQIPSSSRNYSNSCTTVPTFMIQTVQRNEKLYLKRRISKNDHEKFAFTKGADIYEKNIVLPQIMQRLARRKSGLDERKNITRKLILDRSATSINSFTNLNPIVIMPDCNQERLKAWKVGTKFEDFVRRGSCNGN